MCSALWLIEMQNATFHCLFARLTHLCKEKLTPSEIVAVNAHEKKELKKGFRSKWISVLDRLVWFTRWNTSTIAWKLPWVPEVFLACVGYFLRASEFTLALVRSAAGLVCSYPFLMSSRNAPGRALRDNTKNACVTDYCMPRQSLGWAMEPLVADLIDIRKPRMPLTWVLWVCHSLQENPFRGHASHATASR